MSKLPPQHERLKKGQYWVSPDIYERFVKYANSKGRTISDLIRAYMEKTVNESKFAPPKTGDLLIDALVEELDELNPDVGCYPDDES